MDSPVDEESIHLAVSTFSERFAPQAATNSANHTTQLPLPIETARITSGRPMGNFIGRPLRAEPLVPHICSSDECAVTTVLETPEILEQILNYLQPAEILPFQLVNKKWQALMHDSPALYPSLFVEPRWTRPASNFQLLQLPSIMAPGLTIRKCEQIHLGQWVEVRMDRNTASKLDRLCHDSAPDYMIVQPPVTSFLGYLIRANSDTPEPRFITGNDSAMGSSSTRDIEPHHKINRDSGISLGQLAHHADRFLQKSKHHDKTHVVFRAIVSFSAQTDAAPRMRSTTTRVTTVGRSIGSRKEHLK